MEGMEKMSISVDVALPQYHPFLKVDVPWLIRRAAQAHADKTMMIWEPFEGERKIWTYRQAYADIRRIAAGRIDRGVGPGDAVILHFENAPESVLCLPYAHCNWDVIPSGTDAQRSAIERLLDDVRLEHSVVAAD